MERKPTASPDSYSYSARRDLLIASISTLVVLVLARIFDLAEMWVEWAEAREAWEIDEFPLAFAILSFGLAWFADRRWQESKGQVSKTEQANKELSAEIERRIETEASLETARVDAEKLAEEA